MAAGLSWFGTVALGRRTAIRTRPTPKATWSSISRDRSYTAAGIWCACAGETMTGMKIGSSSRLKTMKPADHATRTFCSKSHDRPRRAAQLKRSPQEKAGRSAFGTPIVRPRPSQTRIVPLRTRSEKSRQGRHLAGERKEIAAHRAQIRRSLQQSEDWHCRISCRSASPRFATKCRPETDGCMRSSSTAIAWKRGSIMETFNF